MRVFVYVYLYLCILICVFSFVYLYLCIFICLFVFVYLNLRICILVFCESTDLYFPILSERVAEEEFTSIVPRPMISTPNFSVEKNNQQ